MEIIKRKLQQLRARIWGKEGRADSMARFFIYLIIFTLPLVTISRSAVLLEYDKAVFFYMAITIPFIFWVIQSYRRRAVNIKWGAFDFGFAIFLLVYLLAALVGRDPWRSIVGTDANLTYSWVTFLSLYVLSLLAKRYFSDLKYILQALKVLLFSGWLVIASSFLFQFAAQTQFSLVSTSSQSLNIFTAVLAMISYFLYTSANGKVKIFPILSFFIFSAFLWYQGQSLPLLMLVIFAGILAFSLTLKGKEFNGKSLGLITAYMLVTVAFMIIPVAKIIGIAPMVNGENQTAEVRLPLAAQLPILIGTLKEKPLLGFGPQNFNLAYHAFKPAGINLTPWFGAEIFTAQSLAAEILIASGLAGFVSFYGAIIYFLYIGWKKMNRESQTLLLALFVITFYSLLVSFEMSMLLIIILLKAVYGNITGYHNEIVFKLKTSYAKIFLIVGSLLAIIFACYVIKPKFSVYYHLVKPISTDGQNINLDNVISGTKFVIKSAPYISAYYTNMAAALIAQYSQLQESNVEFDKIQLKADIKNNIILAEERALQYYDYMSLRSVMMSFIDSLSGENLGVMRMNNKMKELDPTNPEPLIYEAVDNYKALRDMNDQTSVEAVNLKELIEYNLNKAIKLKSDDPNLYNLAANYYQFVNDLPKAEENARKALDLRTQEKDLVIALLKIYQLEEKYQPMLEVVDLYLKENENDLDLLKFNLAALNGLKLATEAKETEALIKELEAKNK